MLRDVTAAIHLFHLPMPVNPIFLSSIFSTFLHIYLHFYSFYSVYFIILISPYITQPTKHEATYFQIFLNASLFPVCEPDRKSCIESLVDDDLLLAQTLLTFQVSCTFLDVGRGATGVENPESTV